VQEKDEGAQAALSEHWRRRDTADPGRRDRDVAGKRAFLCPELPFEAAGPACGEQQPACPAWARS
jgi:hypothetical protein